jgi:hypothetical protein
VSVDNFLRDLAARTLIRNSAFSTVVMVTLALGISANIAIFSVVNGVLAAAGPRPDSYAPGGSHHRYHNVIYDRESTFSSELD